MIIDTTFDFTLDTPGYWDGFWERGGGLGAGGKDPDSHSPTLRAYHRALWSKELPNGDFMELYDGGRNGYLVWNGMYLSSDMILADFRYARYRIMLDKVKEAVDDYKLWVEDRIHRMYTIGAMMIFPQRRGGMNPSRGCNRMICDRWDLTLDCIRKYYHGEQSPLYNVICEDKEFFDLFVSFKGYVDFFFLQDCVSDDYETVVFWEGDGTIRENPLPGSVDDYLGWLEKEDIFLAKRNKRISEWFAK